MLPGTHYFKLTQGEMIVAAMIVGKSRFKKGEIEILRVCFKKDLIILGGLQKLVKYAMKVIRSDLYSYVDQSVFTGRGYESSGFTLVSTSDPGYFYWHKTTGKILSRYQTQKHKLKSILGESFDEALSEVENLYQAGWRRAWNCGQLKYLHKYIKI